MKIFKKTILVSCLTFVSLLSIYPSPAAALDCTNPKTTKEQIQCGVNAGSGQSAPEPAKTLNQTIGDIVNLLSIVAGVIAVIMVVVGGVRFATAGGNEQSVAAAKSTLVYAIIGLFVVALAQSIVRLLLHKTVHNP
ncbi:MAG TPA: pilin [Candidatus Saccharimonadales bacterium]|nr:pilin [Candidatus Saccharimonadales bacterium]